MATGSAIYTDIPDGYALPVSFPANLRKLRRHADLTQTDLGEALGVGQAAVSRWEKGKTQPDALMLPRLAVAVKSSLDQLLEGVEAQYDASRDLLGQGRTRGSMVPPKEAADVPASARVQERSAYVAFVGKVQDAVRQLTKIAVTLGSETRKAERTLTGRRRRDRKAS